MALTPAARLMAVAVPGPTAAAIIREIQELAGNSESVSVAAGTDGLDAGTVQEALQSLATRVQALEDA